MKSFILIQNTLTALIIPVLAIVIGLTAMPALALFYYGHDLSKTFDEYWMEIAVTSISLGLFVMIWGVTLVLFSGLMAGLLRPRLEPGRYPLQSFLTIQWAWSMVFHKVALLFLPNLVPSFIGNTYYRLSGAKIGRGAQINSPNVNDAGSVTIGERVVIGGKAVINAHLTERGELVMAPVIIGNDALIGTESIIQPGCVIGEGAVIGSRAVVPKWTNVPPGEIWAGLPAKCIRLSDGSKPKTR
jgi:non-ribosomal peptide synthetase-like protein|tara:strand:+ start:218 stop:946 length:729 start_codon:yes stop_codon:yes gene_type:complete